MKVLVYLHGLGSFGRRPVGQSAKITALDKLDGIKVFAPDLPINPDGVCTVVKSFVQEQYDTGNLGKLVFCGTSLGGFYSNYFGELYDAPYVIANPALSPSNSLKRCLESPPVDWLSGKVLPFAQEYLDIFTLMEDLTEHPTPNLANVFLAKDDTVISYEPTAEKFKLASTLCITETGGHRYDTQWDAVVERVQSLFA